MEHQQLLYNVPLMTIRRPGIIIGRRRGSLGVSNRKLTISGNNTLLSGVRLSLTSEEIVTPLRMSGLPVPMWNGFWRHMKLEACAGQWIGAMKVSVNAKDWTCEVLIYEKRI